MKVLLYGIGKLTDKIEKLLHKDHEVIGYMDSFTLLNSYHGKKFYKLDEINEVCFDYVIITVWERHTAWKIKQVLVDNYGIDDRKIIPYSVYARNEIVENIDVNKQDICGVILGNSHAYHAYLPDYLDGEFINVACPNQDIYYNYKVLEKYLRNCKNTAEKLKYVIFDLYDYNFFNSDISLAKALLSYIEVGGVADKHNFDSNIHYNRNFEDELFMEKCMLSELGHEQRNIMELLFGYHINPIVIEEIYNNVYNRWNYIKPNEPLPAEKFISDIVTRRFEKTILENIQIMEKFVGQVQKIDSECKIILTLLPRYITMEKTLSAFMRKWKSDFEDIVRNLQVNSGDMVYFLNYKNQINISGNNRLYTDINHLNTIGGRCMSSILNEDIKRIEKSKNNKEWIIGA